jgi:hypothetical protein
MDLTVRRAIVGLVVVLVIAALVMDALVFGAAGHALNPDLYEIPEPLPPGIDLYLR